MPIFWIRTLPAALVCLACVACGSSGTAATGSSGPTIRMSTGAPSGSFRPLSEALVRGYTKLMPDLRVEAVNTPGSLRNLQELHDGTADMGLAQAGLAHMAYNGHLPDSERQLRKIRGIAVLNSSPVHLLIGPRSAIRSITDLKGRRVSMSRDGASVTSHLVLSNLFSPGQVHEREGAPGTTAMLLDGRLDAAFVVSSLPSEEVSRHTTAGARLLPIRGPGVDRLRTAFPFFRADIIPAGTYPGQKEPVHTLSVDVVLLVREGLDPALVRRLTDGLFRMLPQLSSELPFLKRMELERAPATPVPLHPGAVLYYRERELSR